MRFCFPFLFLAASFAQEPPTVEPTVATIDGHKLTAAQLEEIVEGFPPNLQGNIKNNKKEFVRQLALMRHLERLALEQKIDEQAPYKSRMAFTRMNALVQSVLDFTSQHTPVTVDDQKAFYETNKDRYTRAAVKVIYISYTNSPAGATGVNGKKVLIETEAKAKADLLLKKLKAGADFIKMVKEHSEDPVSVAKDGDFGVIKKSDQIPDDVKKAIFALAKGQLSPPVKQPNGYYIFFVESVDSESFAKVRDDIFTEIQQTRFREWFENERKSLKITFDDEKYFEPAAPTPPAPAPVK